MRFAAALLIVAGPTFAGAAPIGQYERPSDALVRAIDARAAWSAIASASPDGRWVVLQKPRARPTIDDVAIPLLRLAGWRVDPETYRSGGFVLMSIDRLVLMNALTGLPEPLEFPVGSLSRVEWSPDGERFAFMKWTAAAGISLWVAEPRARRVRLLPGIRLTSARAAETLDRNIPCRWATDGGSLVCLTIPDVPTARELQVQAQSPRIQDTADRPGRTAHLLLRDEGRLRSVEDEGLYERFMTAQPVRIDVHSGAATPICGPAIYDVLDPSPDGRYLLSIRIVRPYSYQTWDDKFPRVVEILDARGQLIHTLAQLPLDTSSSINIGRVSAHPRQFAWRPGTPASLVWYEALDAGDPAARAKYRDRLFILDAPFTRGPQELFRTQGRMAWGPARTLWGENGLALVEEYDWDTHVRRTWQLANGSRPRLLWEYNNDEPRSSPGELLTRLGPRTGHEAQRENRVFNAPLLQSREWVYLRGSDDRPRLSRYNLATKRKELLFEAQDRGYEYVIAVMDASAPRLLTSFETPTIPPNYAVVDPRVGKRLVLTHVIDPVPELTQATQRSVEYVRVDRLRLHGDLYLPRDYRFDQPLPTIVWAYPTNYATEEGAQQHRDLAGRFIGHGAPSVAMFTTQGYAVFEAGMPVVGGPSAGDSISEQLAANATAAVEKLVAMGVADRGRIAIVGRSFGGFMVANLLANTRLFAAGVGISGVYNPMLAPFGFSRERRSYWEAPEAYDRMSPFRHADRISAPLLLLHGDGDSSVGASTIQSTRMFEALYGLGATARLVVFPHEDHTFIARESVLHSYWEMSRWFERYLAPAGQAQSSSVDTLVQ